ncbi:MAG: SDR family oxidoreductase [Acidimicrobiia bacterium]
MPAEVIVVTGAGGMGVACARRLGPGRTVLLADNREPVLRAVADDLVTAGYHVHTGIVDVARQESVRELVHRAAALGPLRTLVHTAGLSPTMADPDRILAVDLLGTAHVLAEFEAVAAPGSVAVVIASMAALGAVVGPDTEQLLATAPVAELPVTAAQAGTPTPGDAYCFAKRANQLRVQAAAAPWGRKGARVVSISPGIIATGMGMQELESDESGPMMREMIASSPVPRLGTAEDVAAAVEWLSGPSASFVTGVDLMLDGGVVAAGRFPTR